MRLTALDVHDVRVVEAAALEPCGGINLIVGANAAGKTSLLEAIHLLSTGRSFAATRPTRLVGWGGGPLRIVARVQSGSGALHRLGLERGATGAALMRVDGRSAERVAELARLLPVVAIHPDSHGLIGGAPAERRRLLDLGLFHVERAFHASWQTFRRALAQRNAVIRAGAGSAELDAWDRELADAGLAIDRMRRAYVEGLASEVDALMPELLGAPGRVELTYRPGFDAEVGLHESLRRSRGRDREQHTTTVGPQRADLRVRLDGRDVRQRVSRGQQKLLVYLLRLAQARQLAGAEGCVLLLDDPGAELDVEHRGRVMAAVLGIGVQAFVTAVDLAAVPLPSAVESKVFHVEQGRVAEVIQ